MRIDASSVTPMHYKSKRCIDVLVSLVCLVIFLPFLLLSMSIIFLLSGKNPLFIQERVGLREKPFQVIKLRTLFSPEYPLLHKTGLFLRSYSLDELPQFINVLRGDMSVVGPRPLLTEYIPFYDEIQRKRHTIKPGITGWAQISGRNSLSWEEKFTLDVWYVHHISLLLDLKIMMLTIFYMVNIKDVKPEGLTEEEKFKGSSKHVPS